MSDERHDYDPGTPYEPPKRRRKRDYKRESEYDDAWAAADEAGDAFDDAAIEDFAAGYHWEDNERYGVGADDPPEPDRPSDWPGNVQPARGVPPRRTPAGRTPAGHTGTPIPYRSSTYHRDRARRGEYAEYHGTPVPPARTRRARAAEPVWNDRPARGVPYWQILVIVVMIVFALLATALACASVLTL